MIRPSKAVRILTRQKPCNHFNLGTVTSASPLYVQWDHEDAATEVALAYDDGYSPVVDDRVWAVKINRNWFIAGKVAGP